MQPARAPLRHSFAGCLLFAAMATSGSPAQVSAQVAGEASKVKASAQPKDTAERAAVASPLVLLLRDQTVRSDLKLSAAQASAVDKLLIEVDYPLWYARDAKDGETDTKRARAFDHLERNLATILTSPQRERLDGLLLQAHGWPVVFVSRFADKLSLTDDQLARIRTLLQIDQPKPTDGGSRSLSAEQQKQLSAVLTEVQRRQLAGLTGKPFEVASIRSRYCHAPPFEQVETWINSEPLQWDKLEGNVVVVHFWAFGCINCVRNLPHYQSWHEKYADKGLVIVGVHTPETQAERVIEAVRAKVAENGMKYPIAIDAAAKNWNSWATRWWPSVYLVDKRGYVRFWWYGELNWEGAKGEEFLRKKIEELAAEKE